MTFLQITVHFLDERYHGLLARKGPPEWPPSPFRLFAAMVAGAAQNNELENETGKALCWLQELCREQPPMIIAPRSRQGNAIVRYGPDNDDKFHSDPEACRSAKPTIPTLMILEPGQDPEVHYLWDIEGLTNVPIDGLCDASRNLTGLGWGIDMAFAVTKPASFADIQKLKGVRWYPKPGVKREFGMLRVPTADANGGTNTLGDLKYCHETAVNHLEHGKARREIAKPHVFEPVFYASTERSVGRPYAVFRLVDENDDTAAYPQAKLIHIAGIVRHLAKERMEDNPPRNLRGRTAEQWVEQYVVGHRDQKAGPDSPHTQFSYVPLQSIGMEHTDRAVRRVMIVAPLGDEEWLEHLARHLDGRVLKPLANTRLPPGTRLERIPDNRKDGVRDAYLRSSRAWATVTPVILPGHDDHKPSKTRRLIEKALAQSGIEQPCEFEWSAFSQFRKMLGAHKYVRDESARDGKRLINYIRPDHLLDQTAVHLRLTFEHEVPGPLTVGAGRHCGFGLFAAESGT